MRVSFHHYITHTPRPPPFPFHHFHYLDSPVVSPPLRTRTQARHLRGAHAHKTINVREEGIDGDEIHQAERRVGAAQDLASPQDAQVEATAARVQLEDDLAAHAGPHHDVDLQDAQQARDGAVVRDVVAKRHGRRAAVDGVAQVLR